MERKRHPPPPNQPTNQPSTHHATPRLLEMGNILKHPKYLCVLSSQIKETLK